jgi:signal transduction histidine kinase
MRERTEALGVVALAVTGQFLAGVMTGTWAERAAAGHWMHIIFRHFFLLILASVILFLSREAQRLRARLALAEYRRDLSAEMHDGIQHDLALMARRLDLADAVADTDPARAAEIAVEQRETARHASEELRFLIGQLRLKTDDADFASSLAAWLALIAERCGVPVSFERTGTIELPAAYHHAVLRIVREAVMNAVNHAGGAAIRVRMRNGPKRHKITVSDAGAGFDTGAAGGGHGLETMRERTEALGGRFRVASRAGHGTRVSVRLPLTPPDVKGWRDGTDSGASGRG